MYIHTKHRGSDASALATPGVGLRESVGIASLAALVLAFVSPESVRVVLAAAGLAGLMGARLAAANAGWARRGSAWTATRSEHPF